MKRLLLFVSCLLLASATIRSQQLATTDDGKRVVLYSNYTWRFATEAPAEKTPAVAPSQVRQPKEEAASGQKTATGKTIYTGPRGGRYHYSKSGKKVYEKRR